MKKIKIYHTHIEVSPYILGEAKNLETSCSVWLDAEYRYDNLAYYYDSNNQTLYLPRGVSIPWLESLFDTQAENVTECDKFSKFSGVHMIAEPRDEIQRNSINFLMSKKNFSTMDNSQLALTLNTGDGKTFCTIYSIIKMRMKAIIITHVETIRDQWYQSFLTFSDIDEDRLMNIVGSSSIDNIMSGKKSADIYFINHKTITSYAQSHGWDAIRSFFMKIKVGIKVYDEAHLCFRNIVRTDMFSNVFKTFYLTATFDRSDDRESTIFKRSFSNVYKFGKGSQGYSEKEKNVIYVPMLYRSGMSDECRAKCMTNYGFSFNRYLDIAMNTDDKLMDMMLIALHAAIKLEGRILITTSTIDSIEYIYNRIVNLNIGKTVGKVHSMQDNSENMRVKDESDIIVSTIKGNGTGADIKNLRCVINIESYSSPIIANQLAGRLRPYGDNKDSYLFEIIDISHKSIENQYKKRLKQLRIKCKDVKVLKVASIYNPF